MAQAAQGQDRACDLLVVGGGAAGLAGAVTAAYHGLKVIVAEKAPVLGGATSWSGGWMWAPLNPLSQADGIVEDIDAPAHLPQARARRELRRAAGRGVAGERTAHGGVLREAHRAAVRLRHVDRRHPGRPPRAPAPAVGRWVPSRSICAGSRRSLRPKLRRQLYETSFLGLGIMAGPDLQAFLHATTSVKGFVHAAWRVAFHVLDLITYRQGMQLVNGTALIARLAQSADDLGVQLRGEHAGDAAAHRGRRGHRRGAGRTGRRGHRPRAARRAARRRRLPERRGPAPRAVPADPDRPGALDPRAAGDHRRRGHASASPPAGSSTPRWPRRRPGARCRWCPTAAGGSGRTRTSSTGASPA